MPETEELIQQEEAVKAIESYRQQFAIYYPNNEHLVMAQLAAFPVAITVHLLYQLWANFKNYTVDGNKYSIPVLAVNDCILSKLFRQTGKELYEMDAYVRDELKKQYSDKQSSQKDELASFLYRYAVRNTKGILWDNYYYAQKQAALLELQPETAVQNILNALQSQVTGGSAFKGIGIANLISTLTRDKDVLKSLAKSSSNEPVINKSGQKTIEITDRKVGAAQSVTINLPKVISQQLQPVFDNQLREQELSAKADNKVKQDAAQEAGTVYCLFVNNDEEESKRPDVFIDLLIQNKLVEKENRVMAVNKAGVIAFMNDITKGKAASNDIVLIYFISYDRSPSDRYNFGSYGGYSRTETSDRFMLSTEFREWFSNPVNDPTVVFIADGCCNNKDWLVPSNPKHIALISAWPSVNGESSGVGEQSVFTSLLIKTLQDQKFNCSYETLFAEITKNILIADPDKAFDVFPMLLAHKVMIRNLFLQHRVIDTNVKELQLALNEVAAIPGLPNVQLPIDGIMGRATKARMDAAREYYSLDKDADLLQELQFKKLLGAKQELPLLWITKSADTASYILKRIKEKYAFLSFEIVETATLLPAPRSRDSSYAYSPTRSTPFNILLNNAATVFIGLNNLLNEDIDNQLPFEKIMLFCMATGKQVYGVSENRNRENIVLTGLRVLAAPPVAGLNNEDSVYELQVAIERLCEAQGKYLQQKPAETEIEKGSLQQRLVAAGSTGILNLAHMDLEHLPTEIFSLPNIKQLDLGFNKLSQLPDTINTFKRLEVLLLNNNLFVTGWPYAVFKLRQLKTLDISENALNRGASSLINLKKLEVLKMNHTGMRALDPVWLQLPALKVLEFAGNPLLNVPDRFKSGAADTKALKNYFTSIETNVPETQFGIIKIFSGNTRKGLKMVPAHLKGKVYEYDFYMVKDASRLYEIISQYYTPNTIIYIKDETGELRKQFGEYDDRVFNLLQYIQSFHLSLNVIFDLPGLNIESTWTNMIKDQAINFAAVPNNDSADSEALLRSIFEQLFINQVSLSEFLKSTRKVNDITTSQDNATGYDLFYNLKRLNDIVFEDEPVRSKAASALEQASSKRVVAQEFFKKPVIKTTSAKTPSKKAVTRIPPTVKKK